MNRERLYIYIHEKYFSLTWINKEQADDFDRAIRDIQGIPRFVYKDVRDDGYILYPKPDAPFLIFTEEVLKYTNVT